MKAVNEGSPSVPTLHGDAVFLIGSFLAATWTPRLTDPSKTVTKHPLKNISMLSKNCRDLILPPLFRNVSIRGRWEDCQQAFEFFKEQPRIL